MSLEYMEPLRMPAKHGVWYVDRENQMTVRLDVPESLSMMITRPERDVLRALLLYALERLEGE